MSSSSPKSDPPSGRRRLRQDETELWTEITRSIKPLRRAPAKAELEKSLDAGPGEDPHKPKLPPASPRHPAATRSAKTALPLAPISRRTKQKLARGSEPIQARIDLHGLTQSEAHNALLRFLRRAQADRLKFVLVITGKGRVRFEAERDSGVLRREVPRWLRLAEFRHYVVGYEAAHIGHGGEGALYVRLRRARLTE
jgi:DNA-nicking Smr family endonuclease